MFQQNFFERMGRSSVNSSMLPG